MSELTTTTCWGCPGCGAVLTTRTAVAHVCGAGTGTEAEKQGEAVYTAAQRESDGGSDPSPEQREAVYQAYRAGLHSTHCDCVAALTARLAAVEGEHAALRTSLLDLVHASTAYLLRSTPFSETAALNAHARWQLVLGRAHKLLGEPPDGR